MNTLLEAVDSDTDPSWRDLCSPPDHEEEFWPRHLAVEMSAYLICHPETNVKAWLLDQVEQRTRVILAMRLL